MCMIAGHSNCLWVSFCCAAAVLLPSFRSFRIDFCARRPMSAKPLKKGRWLESQCSAAADLHLNGILIGSSWFNSMWLLAMPLKCDTILDGLKDQSARLYAMDRRSRSLIEGVRSANAERKKRCC